MQFRLWAVLPIVLTEDEGPRGLDGGVIVVGEGVGWKEVELTH
jgi:hypothetical protein